MYPSTSKKPFSDPFTASNGDFCSNIPDVFGFSQIMNVVDLAQWRQIPNASYTCCQPCCFRTRRTAVTSNVVCAAPHLGQFAISSDIGPPQFRARLNAKDSHYRWWPVRLHVWLAFFVFGVTFSG